MSNKISKEVAEKDFYRFAEAMAIDVDTEGMDKESADGLDRHKTLLVKSMQNGSLVINGKGEPVFTPRRSEGAEPITFYEPCGDAFLAMDQRKKDEDMSKMYASMAAISRVDVKVFSAMKMADVKVCLAITTLFLV